MRLANAGLAVLPLGGDDGKVPLLKYWSRWRRRPGRAFIERLIEKYPDANIGIICGLSGVFLVDNDDPEVVRPMIERFGDTCLKTGTPSGGVHLWYRSSGERCGNLRRQGLAVDLKGIGGFVVVPPSVRPSGPHAGRAYEILSGSWEDLTRLPIIRPGSLPSGTVSNGSTSLRVATKGRRNDTLFREMLRHARHCDDFEALLDIGRTINNDSFEPPLGAAEVEKTVASAWEYQISDQNWVGKERMVQTTLSECQKLRLHQHGADGMMLLQVFRFAHWDRDVFAAPPPTLWKEKLIPGWGRERYRRALAALIDTGILKVVHGGGKGANDPRLFAFARHFYKKGPESGHNIITHPFSLRPPEAPEGLKDILLAEACS